MKRRRQAQPSRRFSTRLVILGLASLLVAVVLAQGPQTVRAVAPSLAGRRPNAPDPVLQNARELLLEGRQTFRDDTFGDEEFWGGTLRLHEAIAGEEHGGVGPGVSPSTALAIGLKVDFDALPLSLRRALRRGEVDLEDPAATLALLELDAVVGVTGFFDGSGELTSFGIQCALCHSTVDDSFVPGIGRRLDGWANRDLDVGRIIDLSPDLTPIAELLEVDEAAVRTVLRAWGPGKFDASLLLDGKGFRPDGKTAATLIPPAYGLAGVNLHTWTGWGGVPHWNAFVANLEMRGKGVFVDPRLEDAEQFPVAARLGFGDVRSEEDRITAKLAGLQLYQLSLPIPVPPPGSFDPDAAARGRALFGGKAQCATCHVPPIFTEPGWNLHTAAEIGIDDFQANRSPERRYRTTPLRGLWAHAEGGFYHDGRFATLEDVVAHYDDHFSLGLTADEIQDLVAYLRSL
jgi:hypothetical protein